MIGPGAFPARHQHSLRAPLAALGTALHFSTSDMKAEALLTSVHDRVSAAQSKASLVASHSKDLLITGLDTAQAVKGVLANAAHEAFAVASRTKEELKATLRQGREKVSHKLANLTTPTRMEQAAARKLEVKARKQRKREAERSEPSSAEPASPEAS
jgi:hypothetical protein